MQGTSPGTQHAERNTPPAGTGTAGWRELGGYLRRWGLWLRLTESVRCAPWGAAAGLALGLVLALLARLPVDVQSPLAALWPLWQVPVLAACAGAAALVGLGMALAAVWLRPRPARQLALTFDRHLRLSERLTTALELGSGRLRAAPAMARAQLEDALGAARVADVRAAMPLRASRRALLALAACALALAVSLLLPNPQQAVWEQRRLAEQLAEQTIEDLQQLQQAVAEIDGLTDAERQALLEALQEAIAALEENRARPEEAVAALSELEQQLGALRDPGADEVRQGLQGAAERMADSELTRDVAEALARGDYQQAAQALAGFAGDKGEALTREEELALAEELAQAAEALAASDPELAQTLSQAAEAIQQGDVAQAREAIAQAAEQMGAAGERVQADAAVEQAQAGLQAGRAQVAGAGEAESGGGGEGGNGQGQGQGQAGHHEDSGSGAPYNEVYVPWRVDEDGNPINVGREGDEGSVAAGNVPLPAPEGGQAGVPYSSVYGTYAEAAGAALDNSYIPLGMKQYVRDYFSSLEP